MKLPFMKSVVGCGSFLVTMLLLRMTRRIAGLAPTRRLEHAGTRAFHIIGRPLPNQYAITLQSSTSLHVASREASTDIDSINKSKSTSSPQTESQQSQQHQPPLMNLYTIGQDELTTIIHDMWGHPKYRAKQVYGWIRDQGVVDPHQMNNIPKTLRQQLVEFSTTSNNNNNKPMHEVSAPTDSNQEVEGVLQLVQEQVSPKDGTRKRLYRLRDGYLIESVLMPYEDGRWTSCISSQAGCAQGCVFCATGQNGFQRQLTADEIVEQVTRFSTLLKATANDDLSNHNNNKTKKGYNNRNKKQHNKEQRLSNIVFMGEGEPLANYRNVMEAVPRIQTLAGIGARKITISTVGIVNNIRKLMDSKLQVRLAVSLHCASDEERSALLPANQRNGGLSTLMTTLREYIETTGRRLTLEWALIEGQNDTPQVAHQLGKLLRRYRLRRDMVHVNVIPLNPTGGFQGSASGRKRVNEFINIIEEKYGVSCTPRVRRGIDIDAGCGQLKAKAMLEETTESGESVSKSLCDEAAPTLTALDTQPQLDMEFSATTATPAASIDLDGDMEMFLQDGDVNENGEIMDSTFDADEAARIISMVQGTVVKGMNDDANTNSNAKDTEGGLRP